MSRYTTLLRVLDSVREEARDTKWHGIYAVDSSDVDAINQARSRSYIHLFLKVMFGVVAFSEREAFITDGSRDGGLDGFYIDKDQKRIYLIQSKFRTIERNFVDKEINVKELLSMEIAEILEGHERSPSGYEYNGKIKGLQRKLTEISDLPRFTWHVIILANLTSFSDRDIKKLTGGYSAEIFNFERAYSELLFPVVSGTFFRANDILISLDLENKTVGGRTSYSVQADSFDCEITVLFIPLTEIGSFMSKYKNAVLQYNPRSYLELAGRRVNEDIKASATRPNSNEFPILNNGLTILSEETGFSERVGAKGKAQLLLKNPQIINGGQTAYTVSRIFEEGGVGASNLKGKEALARIITLTPRSGTNPSEEDKSTLVELISEATNKQTAVSWADRESNHPNNKSLQLILYEKLGIFFERKAGEFGDAIRKGYISESDILDRNLGIRLMHASLGNMSKAVSKRPFVKHGIGEIFVLTDDVLDRVALMYKVSSVIAPSRPKTTKQYRGILAKAYLLAEAFGEPIEGQEEAWREVILRDGELIWSQMLTFAAARHDRAYHKSIVDAASGERQLVFQVERWARSDHFAADVKDLLKKRRNASA